MGFGHGGEAVFVMNDSRPRTQPTLLSEEGIDLPHVWALIEEWNAQYGTGYTKSFTLALEAASRGGERRYTSDLDAAVEVLTRMGWTPEQSNRIVTTHVKSAYAAISEDLQAHVDTGGTLPSRRRPIGNESA